MLKRVELLSKYSGYSLQIVEPAEWAEQFNRLPPEARMGNAGMIGVGVDPQNERVVAELVGFFDDDQPRGIVACWQ